MTVELFDEMIQLLREMTATQRRVLGLMSSDEVKAVYWDDAVAAALVEQLNDSIDINTAHIDKLVEARGKLFQ